MPTAATMAPSPQSAASPTRQRGGQSAVVPLVPFIRASAEHREPAGIDVSRILTAADQDLGVFDIPAYGYLRSLVVLVQATGGTISTAAATEDGPWNVLKSIALTEPNGAVLSQFNTGWDLKMAHKWGGYRNPNGADPQASPVFSAVGSTTGNFTLLYRVPVELSARDGLGSLPNQNAAATFKLRITLSAGTTVLSGTVTTYPTVRVRVWAEEWDQPEVSSGGMTNQITPPAMNTTQFWSSQTFTVNVGQNTIRLTRVGNYIRNLIFVYRRGGTARSTGQTDFFDPSTIYLDTRPLDTVDKTNWIHQMYERTGFGGAVGTTIPAFDGPNGLDNGVFVYDFTHEFDGGLGYENRDLWLPTLGSTRLEIQGTPTTANAGTLTVLTNDVAIAGSVFI